MQHPDPSIDALLNRLAHPQLATIDLSLDRVRALLAALGNPQDKLPPVVHVAGTNGKGSLIAYLTAILQAAGYRVHRYISPHLVQFNERIYLAGRDISDAQLLPLLQRIDSLMDIHPVTFFEATTAAAFLAFAETPADIVLLETGLGGRLDATNMVKQPLLTAITPISIDHTEFLGPTLSAIAGEKAGILKKNVACIVGPQLEEAQIIIECRANEIGSSLWQYNKEWSWKYSESGFDYQGRNHYQLPVPSLHGPHQNSNAATAIACVEQLAGFAINREAMQKGLENAHWPARMQKLTHGNLFDKLPSGCELWLDGGHNPGAATVIAAWLKTQRKPVHLVCGMLENKDIEGFLTPLTTHCVSLTAIPITGEPKGQSQVRIAEAASRLGLSTQIIPNISNALDAIVQKNKNDFIILICGSLYLAGDILWQNNTRP